MAQKKVKRFESVEENNEGADDFDNGDSVTQDPFKTELDLFIHGEQPPFMTLTSAAEMIIDNVVP